MTLGRMTEEQWKKENELIWQRVHELNRDLAAAREQNQRMRLALMSLKNEASGFLSMAEPTTHGYTNVAVLRRKIEDAVEALAAPADRTQGGPENGRPPPPPETKKMQKVEFSKEWCMAAADNEGDYDIQAGGPAANPEDIMRRAGWLSPAEAEELRREVDIWSDQRARADKAEAELERYSMSAGLADQYRSEALAARQVLGFAREDIHVSPGDLIDAAGSLIAERNNANARAERAEREHQQFLAEHNFGAFQTLVAERDAARKELADERKRLELTRKVVTDREQQFSAAQQQAAAMRDVLEGMGCSGAGSCDLTKPGPRCDRCVALATDAGRGFVRAERLKEVLTALNVTRDKVGLQTWIACGLEASRDLLVSLLRDAGVE